MSTDSFKVFYSWASDFPPGTNKDFVYDVLVDVCAQLPSSGVDPVVDRDIANESGAPDIANTIFKKISEAGAFVADVSLISGPSRMMPNPNVMLELGFAVAQPQIGWSRVLLVFNEATGDLADLPFDIHGRSIKRYKLAPDASKQEKKAARALLKAQFTAELAAMTSAPILVPGHARPSPKLTAVWADRDLDEIGTTLHVQPATIVGVEEWAAKLKAKSVSPQRVQLLRDAWTELASLIPRLPKSRSRLESVPLLDDVLRSIEQFNAKLEARLELLDRDADTRLFAGDLRARTHDVNLRVVNSGTAYAEGVTVTMSSVRAVRFDVLPVPLVKEREPRLDHDCERLLALSVELPMLRSEALLRPMLTASVFDVSQPYSALPLVPRNALTVRQSWISADDGRVTAGVEGAIAHGFSRPIRSYDVVLVHCLVAGEEALVDYEIHAKELVRPDKGSLRVRAE